MRRIILNLYTNVFNLNSVFNYKRCKQYARMNIKSILCLWTKLMYKVYLSERFLRRHSCTHDLLLLFIFVLYSGIFSKITFARRSRVYFSFLLSHELFRNKKLIIYLYSTKLSFSDCCVKK